MEQLDHLLSPQDLADYLNVPLNTFYRWRHRGRGPAAFRVGKHIRYRRNDVEQWIQLELQDSQPSRG